MTKQKTMYSPFGIFALNLITIALGSVVCIIVVPLLLSLFVTKTCGDLAWIGLDALGFRLSRPQR